MSNKFHLLWENNPDTPITSENLSKYITTYSEGNIIVKDTDNFIGSAEGDDKLKIKANSKIVLDRAVTSAFFDFDQSFLSHDSENYISVHDNISDRIESSIENKHAISIESSTINYITNSNFESNLDDWNIVITNPGSASSSIESFVDDNIYGSKVAKIFVDNLGNAAEINQTVNVLNNSENISISFYYKSEYSELKLMLEAPDNSLFWSPVTGWTASQSFISIPTSSDYTRFEIDNISLSSLIAIDTNIKIRLLSDSPNTNHYIDAVQIERKQFASSFTQTTRDNSHMLINPNLINLNEGLIDLKVKFRNLSTNTTLFVAKTSSTINAMRLYFDSSTNRMIFEIYDTDITAYRNVAITLSSEQIANLLNVWSRVIVTWNKDVGLKLYINLNLYQTTPQQFVPLNISDITEFQLGENDASEFLNGLVDYLKINLFEKSDSKIYSDLSDDPEPDQKIYKLYENLNKNLILQESMLDVSSSFDASTTYFIYLCDDDIEEDTASIIISKNSEKPYNFLKHEIKKIGGFKTDSSANINEYSIWDIRSREKDVVITEKFLVHGTDSSANIEFRTQPYGEFNDAKFNIPTYFKDHVYFGTTDFIDIDPVGSISIDDITIDGDNISGLDDIAITSPNNAIITSINVDINSTSSGTIQLDDVRIKGNKIYVNSGSDFLIQNDQSSSDVIFSAPGGKISSNSNIYLSGSNKLVFSNTKKQHIHLDASNANYGIGTQNNSVYVRSKNHINFFKQGSHSNTTFTPGSGGTLLAAITDNDGTPSGTIDINSRFYAGRVYNAIYNDLAECWERNKDCEINYNDVVIQTYQGIIKSSKRAQKGTIGVVSNTYGFILGSEDFNDKDINKSKKLPIAISGRVLVKIKGKAEIGDELVSYKNGFSIKASLFEKLFKRDRIIGRVDSKILNQKVWIKI